MWKVGGNPISGKDAVGMLIRESRRVAAFHPSESSQS